MALKLTYIVILLPFFFFCVSLASNVTTPLSMPILAPDSVCNASLYPKFCKSVLPRNETSNIRDYGRIIIRRSLSSAMKFMRIIDKHLRHRLLLSKSAISALEDCKLLTGLNIDFLSSTINSLNSTQSLPHYETEDLQTLLSAIVTNQQTCFDGLKTTAPNWSVRNGIYVPLANDTKLYSVSLALFTNGWINKKRKCKCSKGRKLAFTSLDVVRHGKLPLRMSNRNREIFESASRRKLLQDGGDVVVNDIAVVSQDGTGNFSTITDAVNAAPNNTDYGDGYFLIYVVAGVYDECVSIGKNKRQLMMIGDGINQTVITGNRSVIDGWTTFNSATLAVVGQGFVAVNITFRNTAGAIKHQAVAVRNGADLSAFYSCSFEAYQDTLYTHSLRQFYRECDIYGTVDFIFGNAAAVFQNCRIYARLPMSGQFNALTAQGRTDPNQNTGTSIQNCSILAAPDLALSNGTRKTYLGRPWKEYSRTVFMQSYIDGLIDSSGWRAWNETFAFSTLYYGEFNNTGPGSNISSRVTWPGFHVINETDAKNFTAENFLLGHDWLPSTGVTYIGGLI